jgi:energy-coupling factor transporter ATP-binding protein EcfA2
MPLQIVPEFVTKIIQIFDCKVARHGNMIVGRTGSGKSTAWKALTRAMARLKKDDVQDERYQKVCVQPKRCVLRLRDLLTHLDLLACMSVCADTCGCKLMSLLALSAAT